MTHFLYSLSAASSPEIVRYVGYTKKRLKTRLNEHLSESRSKRTHKDKWIQKVLLVGDTVNILEIDACDDVYDMKEREKCAIKLFKSFGAKLVNGTMGGDGVVGLIQSEKNKLSNTEKKSKITYCFNYADKTLYKVFSSTTKMIEELSLTSNQVWRVLGGKRNHHKGFTFSHSGEVPIEKPRKIYDVWNKGISTKGKQRFNTKKVVIEKDGVVTMFNTVNDAAAFIGTPHHSLISRALSGNHRYKGYNITNYVQL